MKASRLVLPDFSFAYPLHDRQVLPFGVGTYQATPTPVCAAVCRVLAVVSCPLASIHSTRLAKKKTMSSVDPSSTLCNTALYLPVYCISKIARVRGSSGCGICSRKRFGRQTRTPTSNLVQTRRCRVPARVTSCGPATARSCPVM